MNPSHLNNMSTNSTSNGYHDNPDPCHDTVENMEEQTSEKHLSNNGIQLEENQSLLNKEAEIKGEMPMKDDTMADVDMTLDKSKVPDGGWGWFVVFGSLFGHVIMGGFERSDGVLFLKLLTKFNESASATSWVCSLSSTIRLILGPVASGLCSRFSCRKTCFVGAVLMATGVFLSGFASDLAYLYLTYGVISGLGRSLAYASGLIMVGLYFDKRRGLATGISTAGVGIGTLIIPMTMEIVFEEFNFFGAFLILSSIPLNFFICSLLYRPLSVHRKIIQIQNKKKMLRKSALRSEEDAPLSKTQITMTTLQENSQNKEQKNGEDKVEGTPKTEIESSVRMNIFKRFYHRYLKPSQQKNSKKKLFEFSLLKCPSFLLFCIAIAIFTASFKSAFTFLPALAKSRGCTEREAALIMSITGIVDTISRMGSGFVLELKPIKPFRPYIYNSLMFCIVFVTVMYPFCEGFLAFCFLGSLYGLISGAYISQKSVIIVDILGPEKMTHSFGLMTFFQGIGTLVGPPLSGALKDAFGVYDQVFYFGAGLMLVAGLVMVASNVCRWLQIRRNKKDEEIKEEETTPVMKDVPRKSIIS